jgi:uncharacterized protein (DUF4415 family)
MVCSGGKVKGWLMYGFAPALRQLSASNFPGRRVYRIFRGRVWNCGRGAGGRTEMPGYRQKAYVQEHHHHMIKVLDELERRLAALTVQHMIPPEWHGIALQRGAGAKVKITLWVEADVLRFFRATGRGHLGRMGDVLRAFMHARLARVVNGPEGEPEAPPAPRPNPAAWEDEPFNGDELIAQVNAMIAKRREGAGGGPE